MTSTPVKDVSSILTSLTPGTGSKSTGIGQTGFQTVLDNQTQKEMESQTAAKQPAAGKKPAEQASQTKPGDSLKAKEADRVQPKETKEISVETEETEETELTPEEMEAAMAVLETAAAELIQQTADLLGISVEEVQSLMEELGMEELELLNPAQLSTLFLQASGAENSYALVTDEGLYEDYRTLMKQLDTALQECGQELKADPAQLQMLLGKLQEQPAVQKEAPVMEVSQEAESPAVSQPEEFGEVLPENVSDGKRDVAADGRESRQQDSGSGREQSQTGNVFIQNLKTEGFQPEIQQTAELAAAAEPETENIMRQIMDYMKVQLKADSTNLEMQLHPASLGTVQVQIASKGGAVTANFITQNEAVKTALESQMVQLIERFDEQGVKVEAIEVTVQTHEFERNLDQGRGREQQGSETARKGRVRRINLNDALSMEELEEEEVLAADMMAASGNTVDYTA